MEYDAIIVGAGLTGLAAAHYLKGANKKALVLEQAPRIGGRVGSTEVSGFILDHGFQIFLDSYRELTSIVDLSALGPAFFSRGAKIRRAGRFVTLRPTPGALFSRIFTVPDLAKLAYLVLSAPRDHPRLSGVSTLSFLQAHGFSTTCIESFLRPFFAGVFLNDTLEVDSGLFRFLLGRFAFGHACLLRGGAQALPDYIGRILDIRLDTKVVGWTPQSVELGNGDVLTAESIVLTGATADALSDSAEDDWYSTSTLYFSARVAPYGESMITLNADEEGPINNLQILTNVQPSYAPPGGVLISVSIVGSTAGKPEATLIEETIHQAREWFGAQVGDWEFLRSFHIARALPKKPSMSRGFTKTESGVFVAGDALSYGSQNGALRAGREVAECLRYKTRCT